MWRVQKILKPKEFILYKEKVNLKGIEAESIGTREKEKGLKVARVTEGRDSAQAR